MSLLRNSQKIGLFDHLYYTKIKKFQVIYNPYSYKKPAVVEIGFFNWIKNFLKGELTVNQITAKNQIFDKKQMLGWLDYLFEHDLLSVGGEKNHLFINPLSNPEKASFWVDVTNQCNFRCSYCYIDRKKETIDPNKFKDLFEKLIASKKEYPFNEIVFVLAGGEPLLFFDTLKNLIGTIEALQKKYLKILKIQTLIITNGSLLTEEKAKFFRKNKIRIAISLDGIEEYNDQTRKFIDGKGTYKYILRGIDIAKKYRILSNVIVTVSSKNILHLPRFVSFLLAQKIGFQLQFYKKTTRFCLDMPIVFDKKTIGAYLKAIKVVYDYYLLNQKAYNLPIFLDSGKALLFTSKYGCAAGYNYFTITQNCELKVCPASDIKVDFTKVPDFISSLRKKNKAFIQYSVDTHPICKKCLWKYACKGGCKMENLVNGYTKKAPNICAFYKKMLPYMIKLEAKSLIESHK